MTGDQTLSAGAAVWSVADRYLVGPCIGRGGMAEVYEGLDTRLGRSVAVKILRPQYAGDPARRRGLSAEARAAARLSHPNVATVYDVGEDEGRPCIVMELVNGGTLARRLMDPPMGQEEAVRLVIQVLAALDAAHRAGIVHRDIKPGNILLTEDGTAKVTDFGIAKALDPAPADVDLTATGEVMGTPRYLAPERAAGEQASVASDLWAVGVMLYEALTGRPPFDADTALGLAMAAERGDVVPPEIYRPDLSPALGAVVSRALAPRPLDRFASAAEMACAVSRAVADPASTVGFEPPTVPYPDLGGVGKQHPRPSRRALLVGGGLVASLLLVAVAALLLFRGGGHATAAAAPPSSSTAPPPSVPLTTLPPATSTTSPTTPTTSTTRVPATIATTPPTSISCSVLRAEHQTLAQQQAQVDQAERSRAGREAADKAFAARQHAIEQAMRQLCG
ncbi:MAG TPA: serine/threonine-protein kinase [Acidimicrobiales bacterium]|nr:serine/threonine-protein kinase [Acidimicrobiales bacterium]